MVKRSIKITNCRPDPRVNVVALYVYNHILLAPHNSNSFDKGRVKRRLKSGGAN